MISGASSRAPARRVAAAISRARAGALTTLAAVLAGATAGPLAPAAAAPAPPGRVSVTATSGDLREAMTPKPSLPLEAGPTPQGDPLIEVDDAVRGQRFTGVGGAMTDTSAWLLASLSPRQRRYWLRAMFSPAGAHLGFIAVPMGASDFTAREVPYTYDDLPRGQTDRPLRHFSISHDHSYVLPVLRQALAEDPSALVMATPWSPPAWMKTNHSLNDAHRSGELRGDMYGPLARYFVKFLQAYQRAGVHVGAIAPANEPGQDTVYPGLNLSESAEAALIASFLAPALHAAHLATRIYGYDFNWSAELPPFPKQLIRSQAESSLSGIAWHCYYGNPVVMSTLHQMAPGLDQMVSECSSGQRFFSSAEALIAALRNWASSVSLWNLALDPAGGPVQPPNFGCRGCTGILTIDPRRRTVRPRADFYQLAQVGHFVHPGAVRLQSSSLVSPRDVYLATPGVDDVVFRNPDGAKVMVAYNSSPTAKPFEVQDGGEHFHYRLGAGVMATFTW